jgi:hypothetical protein
VNAAPAARTDLGCPNCEGTGRNIDGRAPCSDCGDLLASLDEMAKTPRGRQQRDRLLLMAKKSKRQVYDVVELWNERAAIREFCGGKSRKDAERLALDDVADVVLR